ncbi:hypothetical protein Hanom_Chr16g01430081 [Helianthus anomalus]
MSSYKESNENPAAHVDSTDGEDDPNPIIDESGDTNVADTTTGGACSKKSKKSSDVHPHFVDVECLYKMKIHNNYEAAPSRMWIIQKGAR